MFERMVRILGEENLNRLEKAKILLIGVGGVGGYTLECLVRSGFEHITICDYDTIELSNLNRQVIANSDNVGKLKVEEAKKRALSINPNCSLTLIKEKLDCEKLEEIFQSSYDFVIDACDDLKFKADLIAFTIEKNIPIITCMGTGNRMCPEMLQITTLKKTKNDPLAKRMRNLLRKMNADYLKVPVVYSEELPKHVGKVGTICSVPMAAGSLLASYVIRQIIKNDEF